MATGCMIVPVSAFEALAAAAGDGTSLVAAWVDAHRGEVFASLHDAGRRTPCSSRHSLSPDATLGALGTSARPFARCGSSATAPFATGRDPRASPRRRRIRPPPPLAGIAGRIAGARARSRRAAARARAASTSAGRTPSLRATPPAASEALDAVDGRCSSASPTADSMRSSRSKPTRSPTPGRATCWSGSCGSPTSPASTSCACPGTGSWRSASAGSSIDELHINTLAVDAGLRRQGWRPPS